MQSARNLKLNVPVTFKFTVYGALFGLCFPVVGMMIVSIEKGVGFFESQIAGGWLLWIIDSAPLVLGGFAGYLGSREERLFAIRMHNQKLEADRKNKSRIELMAYATDLGVWEWDINENKIEVDRRFCAMLGFLPEEAPKTMSDWELHVHPDDRERVRFALRNYLHGVTKRFEEKYRYQHNNGAFVPILGKGKIVQASKNGAAEMFLGTHFDMTTFQQMEDQIVQSAKLASIGELASGVAHEINNPLAILSALIERMHKHMEKTGMQDEKITQSADEMGKAIGRIKKIVDGLRGYARHSNDKDLVFDMNEVVIESVELIRSIYAKDGVEIVTRLPAASVEISGDPDKFQQVLMNLFSNAKDAMEDSASKVITIDWMPSMSDFIELHIQDTGSGIPEQLKLKIFDTFFTTKSKGKGTGLGLGICKNIIENMAGKIWFNSEQGKGTVFCIQLPVSKIGSH